MTIIQSIVLGIVQGLSEFLPISSSGHLIFLPRLFGWSDHPIAFDVILHLGTLLAVVFYFRKKLWQLILAFFNYKKDISEEVKS
ncbi:MAG: undecaprenyl-diphosphatase UppP, partial [Candidatus Magasanikbacteria bacterium CG_4_10_14_0_8_um_filter_32_14]